MADDVCMHSLYTDINDEDIPSTQTFSKFVMDRARSHGDKEAMVDAQTGRTLTYQDIVTSVVHVRCGMFRAGVSKDDVILICLPNVIEYPIILFATVSLGAVVTTCRYKSEPEDIIRQLLETGASHLFTLPEKVGTIQTVLPVYHPMKNYFVLGKAEGYISYDDLLSDDASEYPIFMVNARRDVALILYSSGTTGPPKGTMHTHYSLIVHMCQLMHPDVHFLSPTDVAVIALGMWHPYTLTVISMSLVTGCRLTITTDCTHDTATFLNVVRNHQVTILHVIPPMVRSLLKQSDLVTHLSTVHTLVSAASPLHSQTEAELLRQTEGRLTVCQMYGMTEVCVSHMVTKGDGSRPDSVGKLLPNIECKVVDMEDGHICGPNELGVMLLRGPQQMLGYKNLPEATEETIDEEGWVDTGDVVRYDAHGYFYILDRRKEIIKYEGLQVPPAELEAVLLGHPEVVDAAVIGVPDEDCGEVPKAFVVRRGNSTITPTQLCDYVAGHVASYKQLRGGLEFIASIPTLPTGKILRSQLKEMDIQQRTPPHSAGNPTAPSDGQDRHYAEMSSAPPEKRAKTDHSTDNLTD